MPNATLTRLSEEREAQETFIAELLQAAETETRDLVETELRQIQTAEARIAEIDAQVAPLVAFEQRRAAAIDISKLGSSPRRPAAELQVEERSLGQIFTDSEQFRTYTGRGSSAIVTVPEFRAVGPDPLLTTTVPGSKLIQPTQKIIREGIVASFPLLSLVSRVEVSANSVSYVVVGDATGADVVAEGAAKPPVVWTTTDKDFTLQTVAGWFKASRQSLQDITGLRGIIDQKIRRAIDKKLNELAVAALNGAFTTGNTTTGAAKASMVEVVRLSIAQLQAAGVTPNAVLLNPADVAAFDIAMLGKPLGVAQVNGGMWGLPIVPLPDLTAGTAVVGDISEALTWFYRTGLDMYVTDSDVSDSGTGASATVTSDFRRNILTFLGEVRGVFAAVDPSVIRKVVVTP